MAIGEKDKYGLKVVHENSHIQVLVSDHYPDRVYIRPVDKKKTDFGLGLQIIAFDDELRLTAGTNHWLPETFDHCARGYTLRLERA